MRLHNSFDHVWAWHRTYLVLKKFYQNLEKHEASEGIGVLCQCCIKKIFDIIDLLWQHISILCVLWGHQDSVSHMAYIFRSFSRLRPTSNSYQSSAVCCWIWGWMEVYFANGGKKIQSQGTLCSWFVWWIACVLWLERSISFAHVGGPPTD